ncbi:hypothetical protein GRI62_11570 [Erythrobacter arachoides]|uniref:Recombinase family protein n=1 Tax=Aurantiacibacter arachoides TaxID=1850444 RepID=A0A845A3F2_9SPHN|nr:recombinase family protein [Aurantiacibacter arachoides]MXO94234.1 hypothetical protein [Aurantiacibacter arachoides]GGD65102.1 hypothetical protein GCM10011411_26750 [Aurantiacibacter arachoides]
MSEHGILSPKRCAIYTRKSTNKRLDHDVNSLVTQREIASAYVRSQQYKGWVELSDTYDDGGHSGSGLERPALARLMQDIEAGQIDTVVVYKIDRLTRSLLDFVRLIEMFDRRNVSLVSVSQAFDTSDSMGRMILNVLLTFSQFEREMIAERVRDSIRTRKRHGKVHGGLPPFGYIATRAGLKVEPAEAEIVRFIFSEFLRTERYTAVMTAVREAGMCSSVKPTAKGEPRGGKAISPSTVYGILQNPIYIGEIRGHDQNYPGEHEPLVDRATWDRVQALCIKRRKRPPDAKETRHFLAGLLWDELGRHMLLDLNWHRGKTYCAYASSNAMWSQKEYRRAYRANADDLDRLVIATVAHFMADRRCLRMALKALGVLGDELENLAEQGAQAADRIAAVPAEDRKEVFAAILVRIEVGEDELTLTFRGLELRRFLEWNGRGKFYGRHADWPCSDARWEHKVAARVVTAERWPSLHINPRDPAQVANPDKKLISLIRSARKAQSLVEDNRDWSIEELARKQGCRPAHFARLVRVNYLAPDITTAILDGRQPTALTRDLILRSNVPTDWGLQRRLYGFAQPERAIAPRNLFGRGMWPGRPAECEVD